MAEPSKKRKIIKVYLVNKDTLYDQWSAVYQLEKHYYQLEGVGSRGYSYRNIRAGSIRVFSTNPAMKYIGSLRPPRPWVTEDELQDFIASSGDGTIDPKLFIQFYNIKDITLWWMEDQKAILEWIHNKWIASEKFKRNVKIIEI